MRKNLMIIVILLLVLTSCTVVSWYDLNIKEVNSFKKSLMKNNECIEGVEFDYAISQLNILVKFEKEPTVQSVFKIFDSIRELLVNEDFKKGFLKEYLKIDKNTMTYPNVTISFDFPSEEGIELEFNSKYYRDREQLKENIVRGCKSWMINNIAEYNIELSGDFEKEDYQNLLDNKEELERVKD